MPVSTGDKLGPYEILAPIGAGGMGEVYRARDTRLERVVAIKVSRTEFSDRFEREARAISSLNHPHICQLYDVGPNYLVMEYLEGTPLKGPLPVDQALKYAAQICDALDAAHKKNIIHRDLKPTNILITKQGIKLLDFGLAKVGPVVRADEGTMTMALTGKGQILGTLLYMSPEQVNGQEADSRSDIFSFGLVLYEMLTGKQAFAASTPASLIAAILERPAPSVAEVAPGTLDRVLKRCLEKDPENRWQSARDLKAELEWMLESGLNAAPPALEQRRRTARLGWLLAGVFAALLAAAAFGLVHGRTAAAPAAAIRFEVPLPEGTSWTPAGFPAVSPDGSRILFSAVKRDGTISLWIRPMDSVNAQAIPGTESELLSGAGWSPDGRSIVYAAEGKLRRLEIDGGSPRILGSATSVPAWSAAGVILFTGGEAPFRLYQIPASGGEAKVATSSANPQFDPSFLPDGRRFLYFVPGGGTGGGLFVSGAPVGLYAGSLDSKEVERLTDGSSGVFAPPNWLLYVRGSTLVAQSFDPAKHSLSGDPFPIAERVRVNGGHGGFSVSQNGVLAYRRALPPSPDELIWYDRQGKRLGTVGEPASYSNPALSPDGKRLAIGRIDPATNTRDIWVLDLTRGVSSRYTFDKADDTNPVWSPDGSRIAFSSDRKGARDIYWKAAGGAGADEPVLATAGEAKSVEDWSADGKLLLFNVGTRAIFALPLSGDRKPYPVLKASFAQSQGRLSPDGHWIAYVSAESGRQEVFVQNFPPAGGKWQISTGGGSEPSWRRDGKELYFMNDTKLEAVDVKEAGSSLEAGIPKELFDAPVDAGAARRNHYVATADGQRFLFVTATKSTDAAPFIVVQNWQAALKH